MPCAGCKQRMNDPEGNFKMKFVGKPNGKLLKGAPGNYIHGETYMQPYRMSRFAYWELLEKDPVLVVPDADELDDVFEATVFTPDEDDAAVELNQTVEMDDEDVNIDPNTGASVDPYMSIRDGKLVEYTATSDNSGDDVSYSSTEETKEEKPDRDELLHILEEAGVEVKPKTRTTTLEKMVEELGSEEEP